MKYEVHQDVDKLQFRWHLSNGTFDSTIHLPSFIHFICQRLFLPQRALAFFHFLPFPTTLCPRLQHHHISATFDLEEPTTLCLPWPYLFSPRILHYSIFLVSHLELCQECYNFAEAASISLRQVKFFGKRFCRQINSVPIFKTINNSALPIQSGMSDRGDERLNTIGSRILCLLA